MKTFETKMKTFEESRVIKNYKNQSSISTKNQSEIQKSLNEQFQKQNLQKIILQFVKK